MRELRNSIALIIVFLLSGLLINACVTDNERFGTAQGKVTYLDFEGGFWGIIGNDDRHYDPINLSVEFQIEGLEVIFDYEELENQVSFHQWGVLIEIKNIFKK